jgi:hypothetical protein
MRWRIYYDDETTFDDSQGRPCDATGLGVVCIVIDDPQVGRGILTGYDYYAHIDGEWLGVDVFGLIDQVLNRFDTLGGAVAGRTVKNDRFATILRQAQDDPDFAAKSGRRLNEQPRGNAGKVRR